MENNSNNNNESATNIKLPKQTHDIFAIMARGHFIVKRLEDKYGTGAVESAYLHIK